MIKAYVLDRTDWDYDEVDGACVLARNEKEAIEIANNDTKGTWEVREVHEIDKPKLLNVSVHYG